MRAVLQRAARARVVVDGRVTGEIERGLVLFAGLARGDTEADMNRIAEKAAGLRLFAGEKGHFDRTVGDVGGSILAVSQFTILGDCRKGRRPSFDEAMPVDDARAAWPRFVEILRSKGVPIAEGEFQAMMRVEVENDGPVTILLDSRKAT